MINFISGYGAINISLDRENNPLWIGVIQGDIYCKKTYKTPQRAVKEAKKLYNKLILNKITSYEKVKS